MSLTVGEVFSVWLGGIKFPGRSQWTEREANCPLLGRVVDKGELRRILIPLPLDPQESALPQGHKPHTGKFKKAGDIPCVEDATFPTETKWLLA